MGESIWQRSDDWVGAEIEDRFVMVSIETGKYVALNGTANAIWQTLDSPRTEAQICDALRSRYDVAADICVAAVEKTLATMREMELAAPR